MIKKKTIGTGLMALAVVMLMLMTACQKTPVTTPETPCDPFTTTWSLDEEGRKFSISGCAGNHIVGGQSEFTLKLNNHSGTDIWQDEYCILLIDRDGTVKEIAHEQFNVPVGLETLSTINIDFPQNYEGPLGLCVVVPQRGATVTTLWIGEKGTETAGPWPTIRTCPYYLTEAGSRELAERFVSNSPTFVFDGMEETLELIETLYPDIEQSWQFVFRFESRHAGYGDRTGQMLAEVITPHEAIITVEQGEIKSAIMDEKWDMIKQQMLNEVEISLAPIHEVRVNFMESLPVQVGVYIQGGLRDGCTTFHDAVVTRNGDTINIEVTTQRPKDAICTQVYGFFEENLNLGSDFTPGTTYTLNVNDYTTTFEMP